jgi:hypothetical protein
LFNLHEAKRRIKTLEHLETQLRADNQRWELEFKAQQKRVDRLLDPANGVKVGSNAVSAHETKKEIEKSTIVRQLKQLVVQLRTQLLEKDAELESFKKSQKSVRILELTAEKEEYYLENLRLRQLLQDIKTELVSERQRREWAVSAGNAALAVSSSANISNGANNAQLQLEIRKEVAKLSNDYQNILSGMSQGVAQSEARVGTQAAPTRPSSSGANRVDPRSAGTRGANVSTSGESRSQAQGHTNILDLSSPAAEFSATDSMENFVPVGEEASVELLGDVEPEKMQSKVLYAPVSSLKPTVPQINAVYDVGAKVEGLFRGGSTWYKAIVKSVSPEGLYHLQYEDGDEERNMIEEKVRMLASGQQKPSLSSSSGCKVVPNTQPVPVAQLYPVGSVVEGNYRQSGSWYRGTVHAYNSIANKYSLLYDDGDQEDDMTPDDIRLEQVAASGPVTSVSQPDAVVFQVGDNVEARLSDRSSSWNPGKITRVRLNNSVDILFTDGVQEAGIKAANVRFPDPEQQTTQGERGQIQPVQQNEQKYSLPDDTRVRVSVASIAVKNLKSNDTFGDKIDPYILISMEPFLPATKTRHVENCSDYHWQSLNIRFTGTIGSLRTTPMSISVYDKNMFKKDEFAGAATGILPLTDALCQNLAAVTHCGAVDGSVDTTMSLELVDESDRSSSRERGSVVIHLTLFLRDGSDADVVDSTQTHSSTNNDNAYTENAVNAGRVQTAEQVPTRPTVSSASPSALLQSAVQPKHIALYAVGSTIEGDYRGEGYWYRGMVSSFDELTGLYGVLYDDGDRDENVSVKRVRLPVEALRVEAPVPALVSESVPAYQNPTATKEATSSAGRLSDAGKSASVQIMTVPDTVAETERNDAAQFEIFEFGIGDKVDANYRGKGNWYSGEITSISDDGLYDIQYDDDEVERKVHGRNIRYHIDSPRGAGFGYGGGIGGGGGGGGVTPVAAVESPVDVAYGYTDSANEPLTSTEATLKIDSAASETNNHSNLNSYAYSAVSSSTRDVDWRAMLIADDDGAGVGGDGPAAIDSEADMDWMQSSKYSTPLNLTVPSSIPLKNNSNDKNQSNATADIPAEEDEYGDDFD